MHNDHLEEAIGRMPLYFHPLYTDGIHVDARFPRDRYRLISERFSVGEAASLVVVKEAPLATADQIKSVHCPVYVDRFLSGQMDLAERRRIGLRPWTDGIIPRTQHIMGGALAGLSSVAKSRGVAANMAGGTHHAHYDWGSGFCVFNDLAICARAALDEHAFERVLIVDLDVHQGDGTASIFADESRVFTLSVHCAENFPFRKSESDLDLAVAAGSGDDTYLAAVDHGVASGLAFEPDLILFQAGVDPLGEDALGKLAVTRSGLRARNQRVLDASIALEIPCLVFMGGGYSRPISSSIDAFEDLFTQSAQAHLIRTKGRSR